MKAEFRGWRTKPGSPVEDALASLRHAEAMGPVQLALGYTPVARMNPYQASLYCRFPELGIAHFPVNVFQDFEQISGIAQSAPLHGVHLHWINGVTAASETRTQARDAVSKFVDRLEMFRSEGGVVVWTVHNRLPHDARYIAEEHVLRQKVSDLADVVHVMSAGAAEALRPDLLVEPAKTVVAPHPHYIGRYPNAMTRSEARIALEIEPDEYVLVLFGAIKAYKGLDALLRAVNEVSARVIGRRVRLIVAGSPDTSMEAAQFVAESELNPNVLIAARKIPNDEVQIYLRAADIGVAPYRRVLNSGAVALYNSFGLPAIVPDDPGLVDSLLDGTYLTYESADESGLERLIIQVVEDPPRISSESSLSMIAARSPEVVSALLANGILERVRRTGRP